mmetsp:Transcript_21183/g.45954  ORF Transcript_21183/g.45954 Transcript_21183/m.45954 type:complete len:222 (+) Transcript_21183:726-1391(+)
MFASPQHRGRTTALEFRSGVVENLSACRQIRTDGVGSCGAMKLLHFGPEIRSDWTSLPALVGVPIPNSLAMFGFEGVMNSLFIGPHIGSLDVNRSKLVHVILFHLHNLGHDMPVFTEAGACHHLLDRHIDGDFDFLRDIFHIRHTSCLFHRVCAFFQDAVHHFLLHLDHRLLDFTILLHRDELLPFYNLLLDSFDRLFPDNRNFHHLFHGHKHLLLDGLHV